MVVVGYNVALKWLGVVALLVVSTAELSVAVVVESHDVERMELEQAPHVELVVASTLMLVVLSTI